MEHERIDDEFDSMRMRILLIRTKFNGYLFYSIQRYKTN